ncbi:MAG TPA: hypothetical protein VLX30_11660 [Burkholderiales bacterium]|nr:hypothetical protein [Burkholderiales bacterium]
MQAARKLDLGQYPHDPSPFFSLGQPSKLRTRTLSGLRRTLILWAAQSKPGLVRAACETCATYAAMGHALASWPLLAPTPQVGRLIACFAPHARPASRRARTT